MNVSATRVLRKTQIAKHAGRGQTSNDEQKNKTQPPAGLVGRGARRKENYILSQAGLIRGGVLSGTGGRIPYTETKCTYHISLFLSDLVLSVIFLPNICLSTL
jgi:hypothetical protein